MNSVDMYNRKVLSLSLRHVLAFLLIGFKQQLTIDLDRAFLQVH